MSIFKSDVQHTFSPIIIIMFTSSFYYTQPRTALSVENCGLKKHLLKDKIFIRMDVKPDSAKYNEK